MEKAADGALMKGVSDGKVAFRGIDEEGTDHASGTVRVGGAEAKEGLGAAVADDVVGFFDWGVGVGRR